MNRNSTARDLAAAQVRHHNPAIERLMRQSIERGQTVDTDGHLLMRDLYADCDNCEDQCDGSYRYTGRHTAEDIDGLDEVEHEWSITVTGVALGYYEDGRPKPSSADTDS